MWFCGCKGIYGSVCEECEKLVFIQIGHFGDSDLRLKRVASLSYELTAWLDCIFLSCSAPAIVTLQFPACFTCVPLWRLANRKIQSRDSFNLHTSWVYFILSHTKLLHDSHLNTEYLIAKLQANLVQNKVNTWLNKFNLTNS